MFNFAVPSSCHGMGCMVCGVRELVQHTVQNAVDREFRGLFGCLPLGV